MAKYKFKFRVGQKAIIKARLAEHGFDIGEEVKITEKCAQYSDTPHYCAQGKKDFWWVNDDELKPIKKKSK